jgi:hypothetical protein
MTMSNGPSVSPFPAWQPPKNVTSATTWLTSGVHAASNYAMAGIGASPPSCLARRLLARPEPSDPDRLRARRRVALVPPFNRPR